MAEDEGGRGEKDDTGKGDAVRREQKKGTKEQQEIKRRGRKRKEETVNEKTKNTT